MCIRDSRQAALQLQQPVHPGRQLTYGRLVRVYKHAVLPSLFQGFVQLVIQILQLSRQLPVFIKIHNKQRGKQAPRRQTYHKLHSASPVPIL